MDIKERLSFFSKFIKDKNVASLTPSSKFSVRKVGQRIDYDRDIVIVEYGPGDGVFTKYFLKHMSPNSKLIAIETNSYFVDALNEIDDPRLVVVNDKAENVIDVLKRQRLSKVDYVVSGIPLSYFDKQTKASILKNTNKVLNDRGNFMTYQFLFSARDALKEHFGNVTTDFELRNIPPLFIFDAVKKAS